MNTPSSEEEIKTARFPTEQEMFRENTETETLLLLTSQEPTINIDAELEIIQKAPIT